MESRVSRKYLHIYDSQIAAPADVRFPAEASSRPGCHRFTLFRLENRSFALARAVPILARVNFKNEIRTIHTRRSVIAGTNNLISEPVVDGSALPEAALFIGTIFQRRLPPWNKASAEPRHITTADDLLKMLEATTEKYLKVKHL